MKAFDLQHEIKVNQADKGLFVTPDTAIVLCMNGVVIPFDSVTCVVDSQDPYINDSSTKADKISRIQLNIDWKEFLKKSPNFKLFNND